MSNIIGFSKGLYSSWFYHAPSRSLFDCGEGCASFLGNKVNAVQNIFISHDHNDHIAGLLTFIGIRQSGLIAKVEDADGEMVHKPLNIFYPADNYGIERIKTYIDLSWGSSLTFELNWIPVRPGDQLPNRVEAFQTYHFRKLSLGYKITEPRKKLKKEYQGQDIAALIRSKAVDRANLMQDYVANTLVYSLDSRAEFNSVDIFEADTWIADTTFLKTTDRDGSNTHASLEELIPIAVENKVKRVICAHFSPRYHTNLIREFINYYRKQTILRSTCIEFMDYTRMYNFE